MVLFRALFQSCFISENEKNKRFLRLSEAFSEPMAKFNLLFYQASLPPFTNFNKFLETEELLIHCLHAEMQTFMNKLAPKFIKPDVIQQVKDEKLSFSKLDTSLANQKDDVDLTFGNITKPELRRALDEDGISQNDVYNFMTQLRKSMKQRTPVV